MNFATTKERILQYLDFKKINLKSFFEKTGIKRGFLDSDKLKSSVSDIFITIIIENYNDINLEWLLTGKGEMLKQTFSKEYTTNEKINKVAEPKENIEVIAAQKKHIATLENIVDDLRSDKVFLKKIINENLQKEEEIT